jgi:hypothetical protein
MTTLSQRRTFVLLMTLLATLTGAAYGAYETRGHPDIIGDVIKIGGLISVVTLCASYIFWTATHLKEDSVFRGGLAGILTGLAIVPAPYFASGLKAEFFLLYSAGNDGLIVTCLKAMLPAVQNGLATFLLLSKVSIIAVTASMILGAAIAKWVLPRSHAGEISQTPQ